MFSATPPGDLGLPPGRLDGAAPGGGGDVPAGLPEGALEGAGAPAQHLDPDVGEEVPSADRGPGLTPREEHRNGDAQADSDEGVRGAHEGLAGHAEDDVSRR